MLIDTYAITQQIMEQTGLTPSRDPRLTPG